MSNLTIFEENGQLLTDSREVAELVGKEHSKLLRDIRGYCKHLNEANFGLVDFFIESTYTDSKGEVRPNFLITKKGCDMIANKLTGKKGILFTASYVEGFNKMKEFIEKGQNIGDNAPLKDFIESVGVAAEILRVNEVRDRKSVV